MTFSYHKIIINSAILAWDPWTDIFFGLSLPSEQLRVFSNVGLSFNAFAYGFVFEAQLGSL